MSLPADLAERYDGWQVTEAYHHVPGRPTYRLERSGEVRYAKIRSSDNERPLIDEVARLRWAAEFLAVPRLVEHGSDGDWSWLLTTALPGAAAHEHGWHVSAPDRLARVLGAALRDLHDRVPVEECPFALAPAAGGDEVVLHGDYCLPNVLLTGGAVTGFVDLPMLGVGDRWWDVAVCLKSLAYNCGPGHDAAFLDSYGLRPELDRIAAHRAAYDALP